MRIKEIKKVSDFFDNTFLFLNELNKGPIEIEEVKRKYPEVIDKIDLLKGYGVKFDGKYFYKEVSDDYEIIRKIRVYLENHPFLLYYAPDSDLEELKKKILEKKFVEIIKVPNIYGKYIDVLKPNSNITADKEILALIQKVYDKRYYITLRLVDICSSIFKTKDGFELYFLNNSVITLPFEEDDFLNFIKILPFDFLTPQQEYQEVKMAASPLFEKEKVMRIEDAKMTLQSIINYITSSLRDIIEGNVTTLEIVDNKYKLATTQKEACYIADDVFINRAVIDRAISLEMGGMFDRNYSKHLKKTFFTFLEELGVGSENFGGYLIFRIPKSMFNLKEEEWGKLK
ncbi:MAG: hypothetical protein ACP5F8_02655 [Candidatus Aenigmatarchaeota archaeon]|jgi:hypothetical protein